MYQINKVTTCFGHQRSSSDYTKQIWKRRNTLYIVNATVYQCYLVDLIHNNYQIYLVVLQTVPFLLISIGFNLLISNFSKSFNITGNIEIGPYHAASCSGFPGFGITITSATFHRLGTYFRLKAALIKLVIFTIAFLGSCCRTSPVMRSNPGAFQGFMLFFISFLNSVFVANLISSFS